MDKPDTNQEVNVPLFEHSETPTATLHFKGTRVTYDIGAKAPAAPDVPDRLLPVLKFLEQQRSLLQAGDLEAYVKTLDPGSRQAVEEYKTVGTDPLQAMQFREGGPKLVRYVVESKDLWLVYAYTVPNPRPDSSLARIPIRRLADGTFQRVNYASSDPLDQIFQLKQFDRHIRKLADAK